MNRRGIGLVIGMVLMLSACAPNGGARPTRTPRASAPEATAAGTASRQTGMEIGFRLLRAQKEDDDRIVSPAGAFYAFGRLEEMAQGEDRERLRELLELEAGEEALADDPRVRLGFFADSRYAGLDAARAALGSAPVVLDFEDPDGARDRMDAWVLEATGERMAPFLMPELKAGQAGVVAAYVPRLTWARAFEVEEEAPFLYADGTRADLPRMWQAGVFEYGQADGARAVAIPMSEGMRCVIAVRAGEETEVPTPDAEGWARLMAAMRPTEVAVRLPICGASGAVPMDRALGVDLSGMGIAFVEQVNTIAFDERGVSAAGLGMPPAAKDASGLSFDVDKPFFFAIVGEDGGIACMGTVEQPLRLPQSAHPQKDQQGSGDEEEQGGLDEMTSAPAPF